MLERINSEIKVHDLTFDSKLTRKPFQIENELRESDWEAMYDGLLKKRELILKNSFTSTVLKLIDGMDEATCEYFTLEGNMAILYPDRVSWLNPSSLEMSRLESLFKNFPSRSPNGHDDNLMAMSKAKILFPQVNFFAKYPKVRRKAAELVEDETFQYTFVADHHMNSRRSLIDFVVLFPHLKDKVSKIENLEYYILDDLDHLFKTKNTAGFNGHLAVLRILYPEVFKNIKIQDISDRLKKELPNERQTMNLNDDNVVNFSQTAVALKIISSDQVDIENGRLVFTTNDPEETRKTNIPERRRF